jgi:hypothetical protein
MQIVNSKCIFLNIWAFVARGVGGDHLSRFARPLRAQCGCSLLCSVLGPSAQSKQQQAEVSPQLLFVLNIGLTIP